MEQVAAVLRRLPARGIPIGRLAAEWLGTLLTLLPWGLLADRVGERRDLAGRLDRSGAFDFDSHSGSIDIAIPEKMGATFSVVTIAGSITNNLSKTSPIPGRFGRGAELTSEMSGGGAKVSVRTFKGPVTLRRTK